MRRRASKRRQPPHPHPPPPAPCKLAASAAAAPRAIPNTFFSLPLRRYILQTYARPDIVFTHGEGAKMWDAHGKEYLDFAAGIAVNALGALRLGHSDQAAWLSAGSPLGCCASRPGSWRFNCGRGLHHECAHSCLSRAQPCLREAATAQYPPPSTRPTPKRSCAACGS